MLKMVFRWNSLYFALRITFMDGLYLDNDIRTQFLSFYYFYCYCCSLFVFLLLFLVFLFCFIIVLRSSRGSREAFQPKMSYYAKMGACPIKNSGMTFTFMWNLESLFIHSLAYTVPLVGHGQGLVHCTCLTWKFLIYIIVVIIIIIYSLKFFLIICGYVRYYFVKILDSPIIYVHDVCIPFYVTF